MGRIDHINNPNAPKANSVVPSTTSFVLNDDNQLLLIQRSDNSDWALPGGAHDAGESIAQTAIRETEEETGILIKITGLIGLYTSPNHLIEYDDGEVRQQFSLCFSAVPYAGDLRISDESKRVEWVDYGKLDNLSINPSMRLRIDHGFSHNQSIYIG